jgi:hypothetical protein
MIPRHLMIRDRQSRGWGNNRVHEVVRGHRDFGQEQRQEQRLGIWRGVEGQAEVIRPRKGGGRVMGMLVEGGRGPREVRVRVWGRGMRVQGLDRVGGGKWLCGNSRGLVMSYEYTMSLGRIGIRGVG